MPKKLSQEEFIRRSIIKHNNKFDYSKSIYKGRLYKITIICPHHGEYEIIAQSHIDGHDCLKCVNDRQTKKIDEFIEKSKIKFGDKFDYSNTEYVNTKTKVFLICTKHNHKFSIRPDSHLGGSGGCPICRSSLGELLISNFLGKNLIQFESQKQFQNLVYKNQLIYDFYIPSKNMLIEFDGIQHYKPVKYFGGEESLEGIKERDKLKSSYAKENGFNLIRISYNDMKKIEEILSKVL